MTAYDVWAIALGLAGSLLVLLIWGMERLGR